MMKKHRPFSVFNRKKTNRAKRLFQKLSIGLAVFSLFLGGSNAFALPWMDISGSFEGNGSGEYRANYSSDPTTFAGNTITYRDLSFAGSGDSMAAPFFPGFFDGLDITFEFGPSGSGSFEMTSLLGGGVFEADLKLDPSFDFTSGHGNTTALLMPGTAVYSGSPSRWYDEFVLANLGSAYDGRLILHFNGTARVGGITRTNIQAKLVPEPGMMLLLGAGFVCLFFVKKKQEGYS